MNKVSLFSLSLLSLALLAPATFGMQANKPRIPKSIEWLARLSGVGFAGFYTYLIYDLGHKAGEKEAKVLPKNVEENFEEAINMALYDVSKLHQTSTELKIATDSLALMSEWYGWHSYSFDDPKRDKYNNRNKEMYDRAVEKKARHTCKEDGEAYLSSRDTNWSTSHGLSHEEFRQKYVNCQNRVKVAFFDKV